MKTCSVVGCAQRHRARGFCSTHYNQAHQPDRHRTVVVRCGHCGGECVKHVNRSRRIRYCSEVCRGAAYSAAGIRPPADAAVRRRARARRKLARAARGLRGRRWVAGNCERCGESFVAELRSTAGRFCSDRCKNRSAAARRRGRARNGRHERYSRVGIFKRDRWRCHICKGRTLRSKVVPHPRAPVIDHLVPLAEGGDDTAANVATACFLCNSTRGSGGGGEQLALIG